MTSGILRVIIPAVVMLTAVIRYPVAVRHVAQAFPSLTRRHGEWLAALAVGGVASAVLLALVSILLGVAVFAAVLVAGPALIARWERSDRWRRM